MATKTKPKKVNAGYRLPEPLVKRIREKAAKEGIRPCNVAERWLIRGAQRDSAVEVQPDETKASQPQ